MAAIKTGTMDINITETIMRKTYIELQEEVDDLELEQLNEFRILRAGAVVAFASQAKRYGDQAKGHMNSAKSDFQKARSNDDTDRKINHMLNGMNELADGFTDIRMMLGSITALNTSSAVLAERTNKQIIQLIRQSRKRR